MKVKALQAGPIVLSKITADSGRWEVKGKTLPWIWARTFDKCPGVWLLVGKWGFGVAFRSGFDSNTR